MRVLVCLLFFFLLKTNTCYGFCSTPYSSCCLSARSLVSGASPGAMPKNMAFIIGAQKSGTTFLFDELIRRHPNIRAQQVEVDGKNRTIKEPQFFSFPARRQEQFDEYLKHFSRSGDPQDESLTFLDASPNYMYYPSAACGVATVFPDARIIAVLRDPVQRAFSQWNMERIRRDDKIPVVQTEQQEGIVSDIDRTSRGFDDMVARELQYIRSKQCSFEASASPTLESSRKNLGFFSGSSATPEAKAKDSNQELDSNVWPSWNDCFPCMFQCGIFNHSSSNDSSSQLQHIKTRELCARHPAAGLVRRGLYVHQLKWWLQHFKPEQLLVISHKEMYEDPDIIIEKVMDFLKLDPQKRKRNKKVAEDSGWSLPKPKNLIKMYSRVLTELYQYYQQPNKELYRLLATLPNNGWKNTFPESSQD
ncbi:hypothetical protein CEUSTIGMA_g2328.t1 [Chlamydomonas eustigma]|uniref:Sulfotransferase n=1 Tax=Chlamydomonas eustigma TaxID=1157962 RepID=A0A250WW82_9CHLO|nr:hypothetical protein CEUSTIGMA_g2328.t1 [Chlamydomonas eustigma]|eukprot:GAX74882.1 hypothetical protein CEUSTIGMA_g2328.t1 [Chlamydomonas eustigma]